MSVFHVPSVCANANSRAVGALERLCEHVDTFRTRPLVGEDFERVERELHERFVEAEREVLGELLESLDVDVASVGLGERRLHRVLKSTESYTTAVGPLNSVVQRARKNEKNSCLCAVSLSRHRYNVVLAITRSHPSRSRNALCSYHCR